MPPQQVDVPTKGVDGAIGLGHRDHGLRLRVLKCRVPGSRPVYGMSFTSALFSPLATKADRHRKILSLCFVCLHRSGVVVERLPFRRVSVPGGEVGWNRLMVFVCFSSVNEASSKTKVLTSSTWSP